MIPDFILFFGLAIVALASAIGLLLSKSAIYAALNLIINFTAIAFFYLVLSAPFIALTQIAVYAGAILPRLAGHRLAAPRLAGTRFVILWPACR